MMDKAINKLYNWKAAVDTKLYQVLLIVFCLILVSLSDIYAQTTCEDYYERLDARVIQLFTSERSKITRENAFPPEFHQPLQTQEVRRLNFPEEQWVCDAVLESIHGDDPVPPRERALYKVKNHFFLVVYTYYTDQQGNQLIEEPTAGVLFDPAEFNMVGFIAM